MATYSSFKKIDSSGIIDGAVTGGKIASSAVTTAKIQNNAVATGDISDGSVGTTQLASSVNLSGKTVTYRAIVNNDVANAAITGSKLASGAAISNLGFTPLNKGGGTVSGTLKLPAGSAGAPAIAFGNDTNTGIHFPGGDQVTLSTGGGDRLIIDGSGRGREPNRPAFYASGNGGWRYWNSFGGAGWREMNFSWNVTQQGGSNCASNGRFTAPVAGYYWFYIQSYYYNDNNSTSGYTHWNIGRNGNNSTSVSGRRPHTIFAHGLPNNHAPGIMTASEFYMSAGEYACPQSYGPNGPGRVHGDHALWCGFLIG